MRNLDYTFQVERSRFDQLLLQNAVDKGAGLRQPCRITAAEEVAGGWRLSLDQGGDKNGRGVILVVGRQWSHGVFWGGA